MNRWLPSTTPSIVAGALASGVTYGLHALGIITTPADVTAVLTPIVGFLVASVVEPPQVSDPQTLGGLVAEEVAARLDREPAVAQALVHEALEILTTPVPVPEFPPADVVLNPEGQVIGLPHPAVPRDAGFTSPPSPPAPHVTQ